MALCGACGVLLSAPATLPAAERLRLTDPHRLEQSHGLFALDARRLPGLVLPRAFDDSPELAGAAEADTAYSEYFSGEPHVAFADSISLGAPAVILAFFGPLGLLAGALLFLLAALGPALPVEWAVAHLIPGFSLFRYPEKLVGPASLLLSLAAGTGIARAPARRLAAGSLIVALFLLSARLAVGVKHGALQGALIAHGRTHAAAPASLFLDALARSLTWQAALCAALVAFSDSSTSDLIRHRGFEDFAKGTPGNSGHNVYVSRKGRVEVINKSNVADFRQKLAEMKK